MHFEFQVPFQHVVLVNFLGDQRGSDVEKDLGQVSRAGDRGVDPLAGYKVEVGIEDGDRFVHRGALEGVAGSAVAMDEVFLYQVPGQSESLVGAFIYYGEAVALDSVYREFKINVKFLVFTF